MPRSNELSDFGPEYEQLLLRVHEGLQHGTEFTIQFNSQNVADTVRSRAYAYMRALKDGTRPDLSAIANQFSIRRAASALVFYRKSDAPDAVALREALGLADGFADGTSTTGVIAPQTGLSSHLNKLREIRERKKS